MSPELFTGLQIVSVASRVVIGNCILRESVLQADAGPRAGCSRRRLVIRRIRIGAANPLSLVFFLSLVPGLVPDLADPATLSAMSRL